jgi:glycosyltransferase involved in cell wall biosynthesis
MKLGFACGWESPPEPTWSHTPWQLRAALRSRVEVVDLGISYPLAVRAGLKAACARRYDGRWVSMWRHSRAARSYGERVLSRAVGHQPVDAVLQIQDLARFDLPYLTYQDLSYDILLERAQAPGGLTHFPTLSMDAVLRLRDRQRDIYANAAGVLAMSRWFADHLVEVSGVPAARVHVVHPGASAVDSSARPDDAAVLRRRTGPRRRLLFVGRDFHTKAGSLVVAALRVLRRDHDPELTLTVVGPATWPLPGDVPDGVDFRGLLPVSELAELYDSHDLFVLPSRFEGFGIAFVEALAHGLPCVGRRAFAMPEIITPGVNGDLVIDDDPADLADRIVRLLGDDALYDRVAAAAVDVVEHYSWGRAADDVLTVARVVA